MYETYYNIADIIIKIISPFPFYAHNAEEFRCKPQREDFTFRFQQVDNIPERMADAVQAADLMWAHEFRKKDGSYLRAFLWKEYYAAISEITENEGACYYVSAGILMEKAQEGFELLMYLCMEQILMQFDCLVLHSSHIDVGGKGLVFSAPSQTGKSTQAELWRQYGGARVLNGDRSVLRKKDGVWFVYGCPMCGTSDIHLQGNEPLSSIVMLSQGAANSVRRIEGAEAFRMLYPQITISGWNPDFVNKGMDLLNQLIEEVPVWHYACTKNPDAVDVLREQIGI